MTAARLVLVATCQRKTVKRIRYSRGYLRDNDAEKYELVNKKRVLESQDTGGLDLSPGVVAQGGVVLTKLPR